MKKNSVKSPCTSVDCKAENTLFKCNNGQHEKFHSIWATKKCPSGNSLRYPECAIFPVNRSIQLTYSGLSVLNEKISKVHKIIHIDFNTVQITDRDRLMARKVEQIVQEYYNETFAINTNEQEGKRMRFDESEICRKCRRTDKHFPHYISAERMYVFDEREKLTDDEIDQYDNPNFVSNFHTIRLLITNKKSDSFRTPCSTR